MMALVVSWLLCWCVRKCDVRELTALLVREGEGPAAKVFKLGWKPDMVLYVGDRKMIGGIEEYPQTGSSEDDRCDGRGAL